MSDTLARLLSRHGLELARHLRRLVRDDDVAQDLLQDTLLRAHKALGRATEPDNARAWLYRIATNAALNHLRGAGRERRAMVAYAAETDGAVRPDRRLERGEERLALWRRVAELPERQRVAITLRVADELEYHEIAARMACTVEAARANVHQAVKKLRLRIST